MNAKLISERDVRHNDATGNGVVIGKVQTVEVNGQRFEVDLWYQWETGKLHHVGDPRPINA